MTAGKNKVLDAGNWAPSGRNLQQWEFIVVSGGKKEEIGASYARIAETYTADWEASARDSFIQYARTYGDAPHIIVVLTNASEIPGIKNVSGERQCGHGEYSPGGKSTGIGDLLDDRPSPG